MTSQTLRAVKAILEADPTVSATHRMAVLSLCQNPGKGDSSVRRKRPQYVTARDVADMLSTSTRTVWRLAGTGRLTRVKLGYRCTRFRLDEVESLTPLDAADAAE